MKKLFLIIGITLISLNTFAQKGKSQIAIFGGYEGFVELHDNKGFNVGAEYKSYFLDRFYLVANFHAGLNDGSKRAKYTNGKNDYDFVLKNKARDYMVGLGVGADLLQINKHRIYLQGTAGLGIYRQDKDGIHSAAAGNESMDYVKTHFERISRFGVSASLGYDYLLTDWFAMGVNYTGWYVGYDYRSTYNVKLTFTL